MFSHVQCCQLRLRHLHHRAAVIQRIRTTQITQMRINVMMYRKMSAIDLVDAVVVVGLPIVAQVLMVYYQLARSVLGGLLTVIEMLGNAHFFLVSNAWTC